MPCAIYNTYMKHITIFFVKYRFIYIYAGNLAVLTKTPTIPL